MLHAALCCMLCWSARHTLIPPHALSTTTTTHIHTHARAQQAPYNLFLETPGQWPEYKSGAGEYQWVLSRLGREAGVSYVGPNARLRAALSRLKLGGCTDACACD